MIFDVNIILMFIASLSTSAIIVSAVIRISDMGDPKRRLPETKEDKNKTISDVETKASNYVDGES